MPGNRALMRLVASSDEAVFTGHFANEIPPMSVWRQHDVAYLYPLGDRPEESTGKTCGPFAFLWKHLLIGGSYLLGELPLLTPQKTGQLLVDAEVGTDKSLLATDIGIHAASAQHHSVLVPHAASTRFSPKVSA